MTNWDNTASAVGGTIGTIVAWVSSTPTLMVDWATEINFVAHSAAGAVIGLVTKTLVQKAYRYIKQRYS